MLKLYNTLTKSVEELQPIKPGEVTLYACGPTVYDYAHVGNFRTFTVVDFLVRTLTYLGYNLTFIMNITDVGHLVSDADTGEDKLEKGARREGKTAWEVAKFYEDAFLSDARKLNLTRPMHYPKPTELIEEQIEMIKTLEHKGFTYTITDGVYFDTEKLADYGKLTGQKREELLAGARVDINPEKRNHTDFALWKLSPPVTDGKKRDMEWDSPWGTGFPGWHIECSVMAKKFLGNQIDIHTGGIDHIPVHHTNEIAQSEVANDKKPYVKHWFHVEFMNIDSSKMSKSKGNFYTIKDLENQGFDPLALRYLYLGAHYRAHQNFTKQALTQAHQSLEELRKRIHALQSDEIKQRTVLSKDKMQKIDDFKTQFNTALTEDLNTPQALATLWQVVKSSIPTQDKLDLLYNFDEVLGLKLKEITPTKQRIPKKVQKLLKKREEARKSKQFDKADDLRKQIEEQGYTVKDSQDGSTVKPRT